jgi:hypothetical protein
VEDEDADVFLMQPAWKKAIFSGCNTSYFHGAEEESPQKNDSSTKGIQTRINRIKAGSLQEEAESADVDFIKG